MPKAAELINVQLTRREIESLSMQLRRRISRRWKANIKAEIEHEVLRSVSALVRGWEQEIAKKN